MKKFSKLLLLAFCLSLGVLSVFAEPIRENSVLPITQELILLHTNDHHGAVLPNDGRGGLAERASYIKAIRAANTNVLVVDAGDFNTGTALSNMFDAEADILGYNIIGYDAVTFGNHEFDGTREKLEKQIAAAEFPFVSSNIKTKDGSFLGGNQYLVKNYNGIKVGIMGITTLRTLSMAPDNHFVTTDYDFIPEIEAARATAALLREKEKVDIVIALAHMGLVQETADHVTSGKLAAEFSGIDIIVDGHSHSFMEEPVRAGNTWIVSANEWGKYIGMGKLSVQGGKLVGFTWAPVYIGPDPELNAKLKPYLEKAEASLKEVVGEAADTFILGNRLTRYQETALGNMICDANAWYFNNVQVQNIDFAFHNGGNIRADLPKGKLTREQILTVLPFENYLYIVSLPGTQIIELFDFIATIPQGNGGFPQFSGNVRYIIDKTQGEGVIKELSIGGAPVDPERTYRFCTNDYILGGGDGYEIMKNAEDRYNTSLILSYVVVEYISAQGGVISPELDGRLEVIGGVLP